MAASEDLPHLKILAAAIRAAKADIGNAFHTGPGLDIRDRPSGVFASFENIWLLKSFDPPVQCQSRHHPVQYVRSKVSFAPLQPVLS